MGMSRQELKTMLGQDRAKEALGEGDEPADKRSPEERESGIQQRVVQEVNEKLVHLYPALAGLHAIPNGGDRDVRVGAKLKREGVKRGVPDLCLPVPRRGYHGLYIELKAEDGRVSPDQKAWREFLLEQGYQAVIATGKREALDVLIDYVSQEPWA